MPGLALRARAADFWQHGEPEVRLLPMLVDPDRVALDIGAAGGQFSWHLMRLAKGVVAFEPNPASARALRAAAPALDVREMALSSRAGTAELRFPVSHNVAATGWGTIHRANDLSETHADNVDSVVVKTMRLDDLRLRDVGFIKIDVEGHELDVLVGAQTMLRDQRPNMLIELSARSRGADSGTLLTMLADHGYVILRYRDGRILERYTPTADDTLTENILAISAGAGRAVAPSALQLQSPPTP